MKAIGIIGYGTMGSAIAKRLTEHYQVGVFDKEAKKLVTTPPALLVKKSAQELVRDVDCVIIAVKPQDIFRLFQEIKETLVDKLVISIAAGISTASLEAYKDKIRLIRTMPNLGAIIGQSQTCLCKGRHATPEDVAFAQEIFSRFGRVWAIEEAMINAATAITGSGPAYIFFDMERNKINPHNVPVEKRSDYELRLYDAAFSVGFSQTLASELATATMQASIALVKETGKSPRELREQVTSRGGTTEAAIKVLSRSGSWSEAAQAAVKRATELAKAR